jgi:hypothetical protein
MLLAALFGCLSAALPPQAQAGNLRVATQNMRLAMEICLRNYHDEATLPDAFRTAGYTLSAGIETGFYDFEGPGIWGGFSTDTNSGYCYVQSGDVPLALAEELGLKLARSLFGDKVEFGNPELPIGQPAPLCDGLSIFAPRQLIRITYSAAGNSGECLNDGTSAVIINM